ncbi:conserved protein of unknown function [Pseudodesulfovibrio profundus]|uniref:Head protein n=1 Tax=Pseudodesulfovibrio profundus TaxID=57320 RepID=A0A2C8FDQ8_9BACT|nr:DUF5309 family protein [Pseudodesulfovibrio profundus]SOB60637.1 conserved protein of unknown function [Pseudodesulfovibrio profundus]
MPEVTSTTYTANYSATMKDDILDVITNISPDSTPFMSAIGKTKAESTLHQWPVDSLAAPSNNAQVEGADLESAAISPPILDNNYTQISAKQFRISDTSERVKKYGRKSEVAYQTAKKLKELALDMEYGLVNNATSAAGGALTARQAKGIKGFISTNDESFASYAVTNALTETLFNDAMQAAWSEGGELDRVLAPPKVKRTISNFDGYNTLTKDIAAKSKKVVAVVDFYEGDFGSVAIIPHRLIAQDTDTSKLYDSMFFLQTDMWKLASLGKVKTEKLARTGMSQKVLISTEYTLECRSEKANAKMGKIYNSAVA